MMYGAFCPLYKHITEARHETNARPPSSASSPNANSASNSQQSWSTGRNHETVNGTNWRYTKDSESYKSPHFDFSDLVGEQEGQYEEVPEERLPFSWENLPDIFETSFKEVFGIGMILRVLLAMWWLWYALMLVGWGSIWSVAMILCILVGALLFRYSFTPYRKLLLASIVGSVLFSVALGFLVTATTNQTSISFQGGRNGHMAGRHLSIFFTPRLEWVPTGRLVAGVLPQSRPYLHFDGRAPIFMYLFREIFLSLFVLWARPVKWLNS